MPALLAQHTSQQVRRGRPQKGRSGEGSQVCRDGVSPPSWSQVRLEPSCLHAHSCLAALSWSLSVFLYLCVALASSLSLSVSLSFSLSIFVSTSVSFCLSASVSTSFFLFLLLLLLVCFSVHLCLCISLCPSRPSPSPSSPGSFSAGSSCSVGACQGASCLIAPPPAPPPGYVLLLPECMPVPAPGSYRPPPNLPVSPSAWGREQLLRCLSSILEVCGLLESF